MKRNGWQAGLLALVVTLASQAVAAQDTTVETAPATPAEAEPAGPPPPPSTEPPRDPNRGSVTNLPLPRYVTLKTGEGNARRGPGLTHRIDWVFTRAGMPLRITAEYEHWRRVEDQEGLGGWVHYSLLSGVRSVLIDAEMAELRALPDTAAEVVLKAERGVIAKVVECSPDWCRLSIDGDKGWVLKSALWGVDPGEIIE
jgi:SH3-like domain-containing protein